MRRVAAIASSSFSFLHQTRAMRDAKSNIEFRLPTTQYNRDPLKELEKYRTALDKKRDPKGKTKKEQLAHLSRRPSYEYVPEFQRWSDDMMAVYHDPVELSNLMAYHYHKVTKVMLTSHTHQHECNSHQCAIRIKPL